MKKKNKGGLTMKIKNKTHRVNKIVVIIAWLLVVFAILALGGFVEIKSGQLNVTSNLFVDSNVLYVDSSNDRVGIKTANPGKELEVGGRINGTELNISGNANLAYGSGKVGIGVTNPGYKLTVEGNANISGNLSAGGNSALRVKAGLFTRDTSLAAGLQNVTGVGFKPSGAIFFASQGSAVGEMSVGMDDGTNSRYVEDESGDSAQMDKWYTATGMSIRDQEDSGVGTFGVVNSWIDDGFTISWTKEGSPSGTLTVIYLAFG